MEFQSGLINILFPIIISLIVSITYGAVKTWSVKRITRSIDYRYDTMLEQFKSNVDSYNKKKLEEYKSESQRIFEIINLAHKAYQDASCLLQRERMNYIYELWKCFIEIKNRTPDIFAFLDVINEEEWRNLPSHNFVTFNPNISDEDIIKFGSGNNIKIEFVRLFVGNYLWQLFFIYRLVNTRIAKLFSEGMKRGETEPWFNDKYIISALDTVLNESEKKEFQKMNFGKIAWINQCIETKYLSRASVIFSGKEIADETREYAINNINTVHNNLYGSLPNKPGQFPDDPWIKD